jgi:hypothetical protein
MVTLRITREVHGGLPGGVAAPHDEDVFVGAEDRFAGTGAVVDTSAEQFFFIGKIQAAVGHAGSANCGVGDDFCAVRQEAGAFARLEFAANAFAQHQDFCSEAAGLFARGLSEIGAADTLWKTQVVFDFGAGAGLSADDGAFDQNRSQAFGGAVDGGT